MMIMISAKGGALAVGFTSLLAMTAVCLIKLLNIKYVKFKIPSSKIKQNHLLLRTYKAINTGEGISLRFVRVLRNFHTPKEGRGSIILVSAI